MTPGSAMAGTPFCHMSCLWVPPALAGAGWNRWKVRRTSNKSLETMDFQWKNAIHGLPYGKLTWLLKMAIYSGFTH